MATQITGLAELNRKFKDLDSTLTKKVGARMVSSAAMIIKNEAKFIAQSKGLRKTGALIKNIVIKREKKAPSGTIQYNIGVRHGRSLAKGKKVNKYLAVNATGRVVTKRNDDPFYWRFLEFGTKYILPMKFIEPALANKQQAAINQMEKILDKELLKANR